MAERKIHPEIIRLAREKGHDVVFTPPDVVFTPPDVVFTPPHLSDLQPIEMLWADIKSKIARQYERTTTFNDVRHRLNLQFQSLESRDGSQLVSSII